MVSQYPEMTPLKKATEEELTSVMIVDTKSGIRFIFILLNFFIKDPSCPCILPSVLFLKKNPKANVGRQRSPSSYFLGGIALNPQHRYALLTSYVVR